MTNGDSTDQAPRVDRDVEPKVANDTHWRAARWSLGLFVTGLVGPVVVFWGVCIGFALTGPMMGWHEDLAYRYAFRFGFVSMVLASVFGVIGRRRRAGKIGMWGAMAVLGLFFLLAAIALLRLALG